MHLLIFCHVEYSKVQADSAVLKLYNDSLVFGKEIFPIMDSTTIDGLLGSLIHDIIAEFGKEVSKGRELTIWLTDRGYISVSVEGSRVCVVFDKYVQCGEDADMGRAFGGTKQDRDYWGLDYSH